MALTSLKIPTQNVDRYVQIETIQGDNGIIVHWFDCDEELQHNGAKDAIADKRTEKEYHTQLRFEAAKRDQLISSHCTNPEWNPEGYSMTLDQIKMDSFYVLLKDPNVSVKTAEFFTEQGGLTEPWGKNWKRIRAKSIEHAREIATEMRNGQTI